MRMGTVVVSTFVALVAACRATPCSTKSSSRPQVQVGILSMLTAAIYAGERTDIAEATTASASVVLQENFAAAKIPHYSENYGARSETPEGHCDVGHTNECARYAAAKVLPRLRAALANPQ